MPERRQARIALVETSTGRGGSAHSLANILLRLDRSKFVPTVFLYSENPPPPPVRQAGADIVTIVPRMTAAQLSSSASLLVRRASLAAFLIREAVPRYRVFVRLFRRLEPDLVHVNNEILSAIPAVAAARRCRVPVLCHLRNTRAFTHTERIFARWVDQFVATSSMGVERVLASGIPPHRIRLIYNGIDRTKYDPARLDPGRVRHELGLPDGLPLVGVVARIARVKGQREFLEAAATLLRTGARAHFLIVGDASVDEERSYLASLRRYVAGEAIAPHVTFMGWRDDIPDVTAALDIVVQPTSYWENFCNAAVEGMMLEKPVIGTTAGALGEILGGDSNAIILPGNAPSSIAQAITHLLDHPAEARAMARRGRARAERLFDLDAIIPQIESAYLDLLHHNTTAGPAHPVATRSVASPAAGEARHATSPHLSACRP